MAGQSSRTRATLAPNSSPPRRSARRLEQNAGDTTTSNTSGRQRQEKWRREAIPQQTARRIPAPVSPQEPIRAHIDLTIDSEDFGSSPSATASEVEAAEHRVPKRVVSLSKRLNTMF